MRGHEIEQRRTGAIQQGLSQKGAAHEFGLLQNVPCLQPGPFPIGRESLQGTTQTIALIDLPATYFQEATCRNASHATIVAAPRQIAVCIS